MSVDLGMGTTLANFQASGKQPVVSDRLNSRVRLGVTEVAVPLSILAEMSSGPVDLLQSSSATKSKMSSSVHSSSTRKLDGVMIIKWWN